MSTAPIYRLVLPACASLAMILGSQVSCKGGTGERGGVIDAGAVGAFDAAQGTADADVPPAEVRGVDILFVIDNSGSMREEQASLVANFERFVTVLNNIEGGLPDIHIGVVSTNAGSGQGITGCEGDGDNGILLNAPSGACTPPGPERYIRDVASPDGLTRITNHGGSLADSFSCIAELGITGCGFEQPLEAMRRALDGSNPQNAGFLRPDALLAVVIITDEDDCSVDDVALFDPSPALDRIDSVLGPLSSFRCFEFGVQCDPDTPRAAGPRVDCVPRDNSAYMPSVGEYADFLKGLKADPANVVVAAIIGNPTPVSVGAFNGEPTLEASCSSGAGEADPAVRLTAFLDEFPQRSTSSTICDDDLSDALTLIADLVATLVTGP